MKNKQTPLLLVAAAITSLSTGIALADKWDGQRDGHHSCTPISIEGTGTRISNNTTTSTVPGAASIFAMPPGTVLIKRDTSTIFTGLINSDAPILGQQRILGDTRVRFSWELPVPTGGAGYVQGVGMELEPFIFNATIKDPADPTGTRVLYSGKVKITLVTDTFEGSSNNSPFPDGTGVIGGSGARSRATYLFEGLSGSINRAIGRGVSIDQIVVDPANTLSPLNTHVVRKSGYYFFINMPCEQDNEHDN